MIDPTNITKFDRTEAELEEFLLFCVLVAGKDSKIQAKKLDEFLQHDITEPPFVKIHYLLALKNLDMLNVWMRTCKLGQYNRLEKCFRQLMTLQGKLKTCTVDDLEAISGIGSKTARFYLTHTRPNQQFAVLDTHMLHYLRDSGFYAPKTTPSGKMYAALEQVVLQEAKKAGMNPADFDLMIWNKYSKNGNNSDKNALTKN